MARKRFDFDEFPAPTVRDATAAITYLNRAITQEVEQLLTYRAITQEVEQLLTYRSLDVGLTSGEEAAENRIARWQAQRMAWEMYFDRITEQVETRIL